MVEDISLIKNCGVAHFQDSLLMTFWGFVTEEVQQLLATPPSGELPAKVVTASDELLVAIAAMNAAFMKVDTKSMSAEIKRKDEERDNLLRGVKQMVAAMLRVSQSDEQHAAAEALHQSIADFGLDPKLSYLLENTAVGTWLDAVDESEELTSAAELLGLTDYLRRLGELCAELQSLIDERNEEFLRKQAMQQRQRRKESEARWRTFVMVLNAAAVMDEDEQRYEDFVNVVNLKLKELRRLMRHTRRKNPRKRGAEERY